MSFFISKPIDLNPILENALVVYRQAFIATEGQTAFTLNSTYQINMNRISVTVGGIPQYSPEHFTETTTSGFTLIEGVPAGTEVIAELLQ